MRAVVVGAGPAGLMAAESLDRSGHAVTVFDQRRSPARKFVLAGRGGLNITHSEEIEPFLDRYGAERSHLEAAIRAFSPDDVRAWVAELGEETFEGSSGRVFPRSFRAVPLLRAWLRRLQDSGVQFQLGQRWLGWDFDTSAGTRVMRFQDVTNYSEKAVPFDVAVLGLGGASWPKVGSDGSWADILRAKGVEVEALRPANCGVLVEWSDVMKQKFAGSPLKNAAVVVDGVVVRGDPIVSAGGLEGGPIYAHSRALRESVERDGRAELQVDLFPDLDVGDLVRRLVERRQKKKSTSTWLRRCGFSPVGIALLRETTGNTLPGDVDELGELAKAVPIAVTQMASIDRAISSAGGVSWSEVDENFQLHNAPGIYVVGEMLDWEAPTGGYLLQAVLSTARAAGASIEEQ